MKKTEVVKMLKIAEGSFPGFRCNDWQTIIEVWADMFSNIDADKATVAMKKVCATVKFFPSVADVMAEIKAKGESEKGRLRC